MTNEHVDLMLIVPVGAVTRVTKVAHIRGPIGTHPSGLKKAARRPPHETLDRQARSGDLAVKQQSTWGMSVQWEEKAKLQHNHVYQLSW